MAVGQVDARWTAAQSRDLVPLAACPRRTGRPGGRCRRRRPPRSGWRCTSSKSRAGPAGSTRSMGRGGGQHDEAALGPVGGRAPRGPRAGPGRSGPPPPTGTGLAHGVGRAALHQAGGRPGQAHEGRRLAEGVVEAVEVALAGQRPARRGARPRPPWPPGGPGRWPTGSACGRGRRRRHRWRRSCPQPTAGRRARGRRPRRAATRSVTGRRSAQPGRPAGRRNRPRTRQRDHRGGEVVPSH